MTLDSMNAALHDPARRPMWKRLEVIVILLVLSGSWVGVGYGFGVKEGTARYDAQRDRYDTARERMRKEQAAEIQRVQAACTAGIGGVANAVEGAARDNAAAAKALQETTKKVKP